MRVPALCAQLCLALFLAGGAQAQTGCYGAYCPPPDNQGVGDIDLVELHLQLGINDQWVGLAQWRAVTGIEPETRQQCFARCQQSLSTDLGLCMSTHGGVPDPAEHPWTTLGRENCFNYARQEHIRCLAPTQIKSCPPN